ncbi:MAG: AmmeMemoRadiSam system protein B [Nitrospirae bacterium]|nr:AmmeMemoRadiSam system protein B [Nitrospirota bacterium]
MTSTKFLCLVIAFLFISFTPGCSETVKEPAVAGSFYPADPKELSRTVGEFLSNAVDGTADGRLVALISPHAGYMYSGAVAAHSYRRLKGRDIRTVILIGPSHHKAFEGASVYERGKMKTPLGMIGIDSKTARALINKDADVTFYPEAFEKEHSLEVQIPFIQSVLKDARIVPVLIGNPTKRSFDFLTGKLIEIMRNDEKTLLIASTDLSHYHDYETAVTKDRKVIDAVERMSVEDLQKYLMTGEGEMCGGYPVLFAMTVARGLGATNGLLYKYANSGDVTGDGTRVVGYAAMGLYKSPLTGAEKDRLLDLARETIRLYVRDGKIPEVNISDKRLMTNGATFVTIKANGMLRGCIGNIFPVMPLYQSVIHNAVSASSRDPRFPPLGPEEIKDIDVEVTVLSALEPCNDKNEVEVGRHGLYIVKDDRSGILLPQVPVEQGWERDTFLRQVSIKAGLPGDAWKEADLYRFTAEIVH